MERRARTRLVALVVLLAVSVPLAIVAVAGSGGAQDEEEPGLRVQRSPEPFELLVLVDPAANTSERTDGRASVKVECLDSAGEVVASQVEPWPFADTDRNTRDPHAHLPVNPARIRDVERCRVRPAQPPLAGSVS
jgi:hypothetical protein